MPFVLLISVIGIISVYLFRIFQFRKIFNVRFPSIYTYMPKRFFFFFDIVQSILKMLF